MVDNIYNIAPAKEKNRRYSIGNSLPVTVLKFFGKFWLKVSQDFLSSQSSIDQRVDS